MKNVTPRIAIVLGLIGIALISGAYLLASHVGFMASRMADASIHSRDQDRMPVRKKTVLLEAELRQSDQLQMCYESYLQRDPKVAEGTVEVHWMLEKT